MKDSVSLVLVGAGGMGSCYLKALFEDFYSSGIILRGVVEPGPKKSAYFAELLDRGIPIFSTLNEFCKKNSPADLVIIASPRNGSGCTKINFRSKFIEPLGGDRIPVVIF